MDYFVTIEKEVLREVASSIKAEIINYLIAHKISGDDYSNPIVTLRKMVSELGNSLIQNDKTMEDLKKISAKLEFAKDYINKVVESDE